MTVPSDKKKVVGVGYYRFTGKTLGKGNFARVEEAVHTLLNIKVAIKIMDINQIKEDYVIRNLCREAKIMSKLNHPCIAALYQTMQRSDNVYYLVTELVAGGDLCSFVKDQRNGKLEERSTRIYGRQFASALSHMHELGIVHRDLKMENVMLNAAQTHIKIVDFGLSNVWSTNNPLKTHCGSPEYAAPELFVTGKQYGAEVDLWSLGIILYGMVLGHLPFVANRGDQLSSQERRRRLVAQINKGLASTHRRALLCFSHEFRCLMSRLLVAEPSKRVTVKELIVHPWITEKGKRVVRKNPLKPLDHHWHAKIVMDIGVLLQTNHKAISTATMQEPLGKVGGMYNILAHIHRLSLIPGDGITSTLPSSTVLQYSDYPKVVEAASTTKTKTSGSKRLYTSTGVRKPEPRTADNARSRNETLSTPKRRPSTVQTITSSQRNRKDSNDLKDYRLIKSPSLRRKVYSATIAQKPNRPSSPLEHTTRRRNKDSSSEKRMPDFDLATKDRKEIELNELRKTRLMKTGMVAEARTKKLPYSMKIPETSHMQNVRCKSEHSEYGRINAPPLHLKKNLNAEKSDRVAATQSASKTVQRVVTTNDSKHCHSRMSNQVFNKQAPWERAVFAYGDSPVRAVTAPARQGKKYQIYDPIAKCIADYVANNNVTNRLHHYTSQRK